MTQDNFDIGDMERRMRATIDALKRELSGLRTGGPAPTCSIR